MSNQQMANRIHHILSDKAEMGMGVTAGELEDIMELYGRGGVRAAACGQGVMAGAKLGKKRKACKLTPLPTNPWVRFIRDYACMNGITYKQALKSKRACAEYRKFGNYSKKDFPCKRKSTGSKTAKKKIVSKKKKVVSKKKCAKGKKAVRTKAYTRSSGKQIKSYQRCIKGKGEDCLY